MTDQPTTPQEQANEPWRLLGTLPSTNVKVVMGVIVVLCTMLQYFALQWAGRDVTINAPMWDSWLTFVGVAVLGVTAAQYLGKRLTFQAGGPDDKRSDVATIPPSVPVAASASDGVAAPAAPAQPVAPVPPFERGAP